MASDVVSAVDAVAQAPRRVDGIWFVFLLLLSIGVVLVLNGAASLVTRRLRGHDGPPGIAAMERAAGGSLRIGRLMPVIGGLGFGFRCVVVR